jgi:hypothetical protein
MQREMYTDRKFSAGLEAAGQAPDPAAGGGGGLGDIGGDDTPADTPATTPDTPTDTPATTPDTPEPDLLAEPPAKRDDAPRGPYKKHKLSYKKGGLKKQMINTGLGETSTDRKVWPGKVGFGGLDSLVRGVTESSDFEEEKLFKSESDIKSLLESLTKREKDNESN